MSHNETSINWTEADQQATEPDFYGKWVSVSTLPEQNVKVLISDGENIGHARMVYGSFQIVASNDLVDMDKTTHWMKLPPLPKVEADVYDPMLRHECPLCNCFCNCDSIPCSCDCGENE